MSSLPIDENMVFAFLNNNYLQVDWLGNLIFNLIKLRPDSPSTERWIYRSLLCVCVLKLGETHNWSLKSFAFRYVIHHLVCLHHQTPFHRSPLVENKSVCYRNEMYYSSLKSMYKMLIRRSSSLYHQSTLCTTHS